MMLRELVASTTATVRGSDTVDVTGIVEGQVRHRAEPHERHGGAPEKSPHRVSLSALAGLLLHRVLPVLGGLVFTRMSWFVDRVQSLPSVA